MLRIPGAGLDQVSRLRMPKRLTERHSGQLVLALGDALSAVAAAAHAAITGYGFTRADLWPLLGRFGLARYLTPAPG
jgi:hypothetical protein